MIKMISSLNQMSNNSSKNYLTINLKSINQRYNFFTID